MSLDLHLSNKKVSLRFDSLKYYILELFNVKSTTIYYNFILRKTKLFIFENDKV